MSGRILGLVVAMAFMGCRTRPTSYEPAPARVERSLPQAPSDWPASEARVAEHLSADSATAAVQLDVAEAALRDLFEHNASGIQQRAARVCIKLMGKDPGAAFLARFADLGRPVVAGSAFKRMRRSKRAWDLRLYVGEIRLIDATHAEASGGYYEGGLSSSGEHLWLELTGGRWTVVARRFEWIS